MQQLQTLELQTGFGKTGAVNWVSQLVKTSTFTAAMVKDIL